MNVKQYILEVGMIAAIISDNIMKELYENSGNSYIVSVTAISNWALEFLEAHKRTNWEDLLNDSDITMQAKSKAFSGPIMCWDDCVIDFAHYKLEQVKSGELTLPS